jgi:hypothetical protein
MADTLTRSEMFQAVDEAMDSLPYGDVWLGLKYLRDAVGRLAAQPAEPPPFQVGSWVALAGEAFEVTIAHDLAALEAAGFVKIVGGKPEPTPSMCGVVTWGKPELGEWYMGLHVDGRQAGWCLYDAVGVFHEGLYGGYRWCMEPLAPTAAPSPAPAPAPAPAPVLAGEAFLDSLPVPCVFRFEGETYILRQGKYASTVIEAIVQRAGCACKGGKGGTWDLNDLYGVEDLADLTTESVTVLWHP